MDRQTQTSRSEIDQHSSDEENLSDFPEETSFQGDVIDVETISTAEDIDAVLEPVVRDLDNEGWPYEIQDDGSRIALKAAADEEQWDVLITPFDDELCLITSRYPHSLSDTGPEFTSRILAYNGTIRRGGFAYDQRRERLTFRTPFVPSKEPTSDALGENVTAIVEHL